MSADESGYFATIPEWVLDAEVSDRAVRVYCALSRYANEDGACWPSRATLAQRLRCSLDSIDRALVELVALGAIEKQQRLHDYGDNDTNIYLLGSRTGAAPSPQWIRLRTPSQRPEIVGTIDANVSSTISTRVSDSSSANAISRGLHRMFTGLTTPPIHQTAYRYSW